MHNCGQVSNFYAAHLIHFLYTADNVRLINFCTITIIVIIIININACKRLYNMLYVGDRHKSLRMINKLECAGVLSLYQRDMPTIGAH